MLRGKGLLKTAVDTQWALWASRAKVHCIKWTYSNTSMRLLLWIPFIWQFWHKTHFYTSLSLLNQPEPLRAWLSFAGGVDPSPSNRSLKCPCHWNPWFNFSRWDWLHHSSLIPLPMFDHSLTWWHGLITCPSTMLPPKERKAPELFTYTYSSLMQGASKISISAARQVYIYI